MLSKIDIQKELGKGIAVVPFNENNIKDNSINLSAGKFAWSTVDHNYYYNDSKNDDIIFGSEEEIPKNKRAHYKTRLISCGNSTVISQGKQKVILLFPHATTYVETLEVLSTGGNIGGTCHSKVGTSATGIGHIGTMMGPNFSGNCFVPLHNPTDKLLTLKVGETFMSVVFNHLDTPIHETNATTGGHTDKFAALGIHASDSELSELNQDWKRSHKTVVEHMNNDKNYSDYKKSLFRHRVASLFSKKNIITAIVLVLIFIGLSVLASYIDKKNGTAIWSDRFWTVMAAGVIVYLLQLLVAKNQ